MPEPMHVIWIWDARGNLIEKKRFMMYDAEEMDAIFDDLVAEAGSIGADAITLDWCGREIRRVEGYACNRPECPTGTVVSL